MLTTDTSTEVQDATFVEDAVRTAVESIAERFGHDWLAAATAVEVNARRLAMAAHDERQKGW